MVGIKMPKAQNSGNGLSHLTGILQAAASGDPMAIAGSLSGDSPLGKALGAYSQASSLSNLSNNANGVANPLLHPPQGPQAPSLGGDEMSKSLGEQGNKAAQSMLADLQSDNYSPTTDQNFKNPEMGSQFSGNDSSTAMSRALQGQQQNPQYLIHQGLQHLDDPSLNLPYEVRMGAVQPLLQAKHGTGPDLSGNGQMDNGGY